MMASIRKRTTSTGEVRWDARVRAGRRVLTRTHRTRKLAEEWARRQEDAYRSGNLLDPDIERTTVAAYAEGWLAARPLAPKTRESYDAALRIRILPQLGDHEVRHLSPDIVRRWWARLPDEHPAANAKAYRVLSAMCETAIEDGILTRDPCTVKGAGRERSPERPLIEPHQIVTVISASRERGRALLMLAAWGGLRRGEILGLERRHIDLLHGELIVEQQAQWITGGKRIVRPPKSDAGIRRVQLPEVLAVALESHLEDYVAPDPAAPVAVTARGKPLTPAGLNRWWREARDEVGFHGLRMHDLRHAAGTMAAWSGATVRELMALLGHSSPAAAMRYQHVAQSRSREIADALDAIARGDITRPTVLRTREGRAKEGEADTG